MESINTKVQHIGNLNIGDPEHGDVKLSVFPFEWNGKSVELPAAFKQWEEPLKEIMKLVPLQEGANTHYVTIDSKFFTQDEFLRREGIHIDGNFCVDPNFTFKNGDPKASWGGASPKPSWAGMKLNAMEELPNNAHVEMDWVLPYDIIIPFGDYISGDKGGMLCVSTEVGCQAWSGEFYGEVESGGSFKNMEDQLTNDRKTVFEANELYFMSSNTPHETLLIKKGTRRTFMRVTLNHEYLNEQVLETVGFKALEQALDVDSKFEFFCEECGTIHTKNSYAIAQAAMTVDLDFTCDCGNVIPLEE